MLKKFLAAVLLTPSVFAPPTFAVEGDSATDSPTAWRKNLADFVGNYCADCHGDEPGEGELILQPKELDLTQTASIEKWAKVYDKLIAGEMPPADLPQPEAEERAAIVATLAEELHAADSARQTMQGRVQYRRLTRVQYENTLRDLLALPNLEDSGMLPPDSSAHGFDNVGAALDLSYVQMSRYLEAANHALDEAMVLGPRPKSTTTHLEAVTNGRFEQVIRKQKEAVTIEGAVGLLRQPNTAQAPWWWSKLDLPVDGMYRIKMKTFGFVWDRGEVQPADRTHAISYQAVQQTNKRSLGTFDVGRSAVEPTVHDFTTFLRRGDQLQIWIETLDDRNKGQRELNEYTAPGVALQWLEVEGPLVQQWPPASYRQLFGDLPCEVWAADSGVNQPPLPLIVQGVGKRAQQEIAKPDKTTLYHVVSKQPAEDAQQLLLDFAERAFRRPVQTADVEDFVALVQVKLDQQLSFQEAMRIGYQAILCSPEFLFLQEQPGRLDDYALAARLSYFLWNSMPDAQLLTLASEGELSQAATLRQQVERMLDDPRAARFVESFCGQWLDLRRITVTQPDEQLYPEFNQLLLDSMVRETHAYFSEMLRNDLGASYLVAADFAMINGRLAQLYEITGVDGVAIRKVALPKESPRGGLLTQASVLKVTANGTTTSPVTRGAWVLDRLYGRPAPLPPPNVPAVEPDLRGTTTIREQLAKHRDVAGCASCHRRIDPPGFALESFDVIGGWRERYRSLEVGTAVKTTFHGDRPVRYKLGLPVDASGVAPGGESFDNIDDFREILLSQREQLARNIVERLLVYSTGAGIQFADRQVVEQILNSSREQDYGLRTLIHAVVQSPTFQSK